MHADERIASLARRVRWLDDHRRSISSTVAIVGAALGFVLVPYLLGDDWPRFHARITAVAAALVLAFVLDVSLAAMTAAWEVRHDRLSRDLRPGLPRAVVRKK